MPNARTDARSPESGFTLLEIIVVIAVAGLIMGSAVRGFRSVVQSDMRASAAQISGMMRFLFDRASTTGKMHRLVLDLAQNQIWAEASDDRYFIPRERETDLSREKEAEKQQKLDEEERRKLEETSAKTTAMGTTVLDVSSIPTDFQPKRPRFAAFKETALKPMALKKAKIVDVYTPRLADPITAGRAYIYFFPMGQTEAAMVHLSSPKGDLNYTLEVHPITGRVKVFNSYRKPPVEERFDDEGNRIDQ